jgi:SAM-dependent methyltransferase
MVNRFNRVIRPDDFDSEEFMQYARIASGRPNFPRHKKFWEWGKGLQALTELGYLDRNKIAVGLGVGLEPFAYVISKRVQHVYRTDRVDSANPWMKDYAKRVQVESGKPDFVPAGVEYDAGRVSFLNVDATDLRQFENESVDIVFSFSSIEHFGDRLKSPPHGCIKCMQESERILRPGGVCLGATELLLTRKKHHQFFLKEDFIEEVVNSHGMKPIEPFDFDVDALQNSKYFFPAILRGVFGDKLLYQDEIMGFIVGEAVSASMFYVFNK